jgi:glycosyltransferase involved in cell wall biosynthesis
MIETGAELSNSARIRKRCDNTPLVLCWSGLFCGIKALPLLLRALAGLRNHDWILHVIGDGPEKANWMKELHFLNLGDRIVFHGQVTRVQALEIMDMADVLVHSSVKEGTPHVVLEALSSGMPVICHDACGMGVAVDESCGIKVPLVEPEASVAGFRSAIKRMLVQPDLLEGLSRGALARSVELSWSRKIEHYLAAYAETMRGQSAEDDRDDGN